MILAYAFVNKDTKKTLIQEPALNVNLIKFGISKNKYVLAIQIMKSYVKDVEIIKFGIVNYQNVNAKLVIKFKR